jgi:hypothetical protein
VSRLSVEDRYKGDPVFYALVNMLRVALEQNDYTPTELREACMLAATIHENQQFRNLYGFVPPLEGSAPERGEGA